MPRDSSDSSSRKKDKHSSRDSFLRDCGKVFEVANEFSARKKVEKYSADIGKSSKKGEASSHNSGRKRHYVDHDDSFASECNDFEDSRKLVRNSTHVIQQHSRNGLMLPGIASRHSLVDYDDETSDSDLSSESFPAQKATGKSSRRKSTVEVVSASIKADLNEIRQQSHLPDTTVSRHVRLSSSGSCKKQPSTDSDNYDAKNDKKKHWQSPTASPKQDSSERKEKKRHKHSVVDSPKPDSRAKDIPAKSSKRHHSKENGSRKCDDAECDVNLVRANSQTSHIAESVSAVKSKSKGRDGKQTKKCVSEAASSDTRTEKYKSHKKSKRHEVSEELQQSESDKVKQRSLAVVSKPSSVHATVHKKELVRTEDSFGQCKTSEKNDRHKKTGIHVDSVLAADSLEHGSAGKSTQQDDRVLKHHSDDRVHAHKTCDREKHGSKKKSLATENSDSDSDKEKKENAASKHDSHSTGSRGDKVKDKKHKEKLHSSKSEREFSEEGQISSDSSGGRVKESKHKRRSHATFTKTDRSGTPVKSSYNASSSKKAVTSEVSLPER